MVVSERERMREREREKKKYRERERERGSDFAEGRTDDHRKRGKSNQILRIIIEI
jgi:hypothetical protein